MTQLQFHIRGQTISRADRFIVVAKSIRYLTAHFGFLTDDWEGLAKVAIFTGDDSYKMILDNDGDCFVPWELLQKAGTVTVSVYGLSDDESPVLATTNTALVTVLASGFTDDDAVNEPEPTPTVWEQILVRLENTDGGLYTDWGDEDGDTEQTGQ